MCFSPEASFASAAVLVPFGTYTLRLAARTAPRLWPLALVPCVFGLQQACEGVVWLGLESGDDRLTRPAARAYLFFALAFPVLGYGAEVGIAFGLLFFTVNHLVLILAGFVSFQLMPPPTAPSE